METYIKSNTSLQTPAAAASSPAATSSRTIRTALLTVLAALTLLATAGCEKAAQITSIKFETDEIKIEEGKTAVLKITVEPEGAATDGLLWSSSNTRYVTVDNGTITAAGIGNANISVSTRDGSVKAKCFVNVVPIAIKVTGITLERTKLSIAVGETVEIKTNIEPNNATDKSVTWTSSDESIAKISGSRISGIKIGTAKITATTADGGKTAVCEVNVKDPILFSDNKFKASLVDKFDTDGDGAVSKEEAAAAKSIDCSDLSITSLSGLEFFTNLEELNCSKNEIKSIDLTSLSKLKKLDCSDNLIATIDLRTTALAKYDGEGTPLDCSPMNWNDVNVLDTVYLDKGQVIKYVNGEGAAARNKEYVPEKTIVAVIGEQFYFSLNDLTINPYGSLFDLGIKSDMDYSLTTVPDWIKLKGTKGLTSSEYSFEVDMNNDGSARTGAIVFTDANRKTHSLTVSQKSIIQAVPGWESKEFFHKSLGIKFTATWCQYCPKLADNFHAAQEQKPGKIELVNIHGNGSALAFAYADVLMNLYGVNSYPTCIMDGWKNVYTTAEIIGALEATESSYPVSTAIAIQSTLSGRDAVVEVMVYLKASSQCKITVLLLEDGIDAEQKDYYNGDHSHYTHNDVARNTLTEVTGDTFETASANTTYSVHYNVSSIQQKYDMDNMRVLVYVQRKYGRDYIIDNCATVKLGEDLAPAFK